MTHSPWRGARGGWAAWSWRACAPLHTAHSPCCFAEPDLLFWLERPRTCEREVGGVGGAMDGGGLWTTAPSELRVSSVCVGGAVDAQPLERRTRWVGGAVDGVPARLSTPPTAPAASQNQRERERETKCAAMENGAALQVERRGRGMLWAARRLTRVRKEMPRSLAARVWLPAHCSRASMICWR